MAALALRGVTKVYPDGHQAVIDVDLDVADGEFVTLLGPSGCGKTTVVRLVAGLETPTTGTIRLGDRILNDLPPRRRNIGMVAERPVMPRSGTTRTFIGNPVRYRRRDPAEPVERAARRLSIRHRLDARVDHLSGGQRQLAQAAKAAVADPDLFLFDEPFSTVDAVTRRAVRHRLVTARRDHPITTLMVTGDQADAMALSDRIAVMSGGMIHHVGPPDEVYERPATAVVAQTIGDPPMAIFGAEVDAAPGGGFDLRVGRVVIRAWTPLLDRFRGGSVLVGVRAHELTLDDPSTSRSGLPAVVRSVEPLGPVTHVTCELETAVCVTAAVERMGRIVPGDAVRLGVAVDRMHLFAPTGEALLHPA